MNIRNILLAMILGSCALAPLAPCEYHHDKVPGRELGHTERCFVQWLCAGARTDFGPFGFSMDFCDLTVSYDLRGSSYRHKVSHDFARLLQTGTIPSLALHGRDGAICAKMVLADAARPRSATPGRTPAPAATYRGGSSSSGAPRSQSAGAGHRAPAPAPAAPREIRLSGIAREAIEALKEGQFVQFAPKYPNVFVQFRHRDGNLKTCTLANFPAKISDAQTASIFFDDNPDVKCGIITSQPAVPAGHRAPAVGANIELTRIGERLIEAIKNGTLRESAKGKGLSVFYTIDLIGKDGKFVTGQSSISEFFNTGPLLLGMKDLSIYFPTKPGETFKLIENGMVCGTQMTSTEAFYKISPTRPHADAGGHRRRSASSGAPRSGSYGAGHRAPSGGPADNRVGSKELNRALFELFDSNKTPDRRFFDPAATRGLRVEYDVKQGANGDKMRVAEFMAMARNPDFRDSIKIVAAVDREGGVHIAWPPQTSARSGSRGAGHRASSHGASSASTRPRSASHGPSGATRSRMIEQAIQNLFNESSPFVLDPNKILEINFKPGQAPVVHKPGQGPVVLKSTVHPTVPEFFNTHWNGKTPDEKRSYLNRIDSMRIFDKRNPGDKYPLTIRSK